MPIASVDVRIAYLPMQAKQNKIIFQIFLSYLSKCARAASCHCHYHSFTLAGILALAAIPKGLGQIEKGEGIGIYLNTLTKEYPEMDNLALSGALGYPITGTKYIDYDKWLTDLIEYNKMKLAALERKL